VLHYRVHGNVSTLDKLRNSRIREQHYSIKKTIYSTEEEIKERIAAAGNRAYHVHKKLFTSKLISQNVKLQLYNTLIRPIITYASET
jgi:hypothetical protein